MQTDHDRLDGDTDGPLRQLMKYMKLDQKGAVLAEYIWIDGTNGVRSKTKVSQSVANSHLLPRSILAVLACFFLCT